MPVSAATAPATSVPVLTNYIDGRRSASVVEQLDDRDPATGELTASVPLSGAYEVDAAVRAAAAAQPSWRAVAPQQRARALLALRESLTTHAEELAGLVTSDKLKHVMVRFS